MLVSVSCLALTECSLAGEVTSTQALSYQSLILKYTFKVLSIAPIQPRLSFLILWLHLTPFTYNTFQYMGGSSFGYDTCFHYHASTLIQIYSSHAMIRYVGLVSLLIQAFRHFPY